MASRDVTVFGYVLEAVKWVVNSSQRSLHEFMEFLRKFLNHVTTLRRSVVTKILHFTAPCTDRYVMTASMFSSGSVVPSYEYIWGGFSKMRGIRASRIRRVNGPYALRSFRVSWVSLELEGDQERLLHFGGDLLARDRLGGDHLGDLLLADLLVRLGDLTLTECRGDLEREWRGLLPLLLCVGGRSLFGSDCRVYLLQIHQASVLFLD